MWFRLEYYGVHLILKPVSEFLFWTIHDSWHCFGWQGKVHTSSNALWFHNSSYRYNLRLALDSMHWIQNDVSYMLQFKAYCVTAKDHVCNHVIKYHIVFKILNFIHLSTQSNCFCVHICSILLTTGCGRISLHLNHKDFWRVLLGFSGKKKLTFSMCHSSRQSVTSCWRNKNARHFIGSGSIS